MEWVETTAKSLEEAKGLALDQLGVAEDEVDVVGCRGVRIPRLVPRGAPHEGAGERVGDDSRWLADGMTVSVTLFNGQPIGISLPISVTLQVVSSGIGKQTKPATLSTGAIVEVPLFVNDGDWVKIGTQTGLYIERINRKA